MPTLNAQKALRVGLVSAVIVALGAGTAAGAAPLHRAAVQKKQRTLIVTTAGGAYGDVQFKYLFGAYTRATGVKVVRVNVLDTAIAQLKAQEDAHAPQWDLMSDRFLSEEIELSSHGYLQPINYKIVKKKDLKNLAYSAIPYGVPMDAACFCMAWRKDSFTTQPTKIQDFFNPQKFPGPRGIAGVLPWETMTVALAASGVRKGKLTPFNYQRAFAELDKIKKDAVFWQSGDQLQQILRNKEVTMALGFEGRFGALQNEGLPLAITDNGGYPERTFWIVPKNPPDGNEAMKFLEWWLTHGRADGQWASHWPRLSPAVLSAYKYLPAKFRATLLFSPKNLKKIVPFSVKDETWVGNHLDEINTKWTQWLSG